MIQLCFSVYAAAEENSYVSAEEISGFRGRNIESLFIRPPSLTLTPS